MNKEVQGPQRHWSTCPARYCNDVPCSCPVGIQSGDTAPDPIETLRKCLQLLDHPDLPAHLDMMGNLYEEVKAAIEGASTRENQ